MVVSSATNRKRPYRRHRARWIHGCLAAALMIVASGVYHPVLIHGSSMAPTLPDGALVWMDRGWYRRHLPQPGEVVVFRYRGATYVKRVYRGPGATLHCVIDRDDCIIPIREANYHTIRTRFLDMDKRKKPHFRLRKLSVPADSVFVLGDNLLKSVDSRSLGYIPIRSILGRARLPADCTRAAQSELTFPPLREVDTNGSAASTGRNHRAGSLVTSGPLQPAKAAAASP